jgi:hypothetical protein
MKHYAPAGQVHEDHPALKGDDGVEGVAHRRFGGGTVAAVDDEVGVTFGRTCTTKARSRARHDKELWMR